MNGRPPSEYSDTIKLRTGVLRKTRESGWTRCAECDAPVDISDVQPLTAVKCPSCGKVFKALRDFGPFNLQQVIGQGGLGVVYRALDTDLGRPVALKLLRDDITNYRNDVGQLQAEAATMAAISEAHVVRVYSTGTLHGHFYIAMEILPGGSLQQLLDSAGSIEEALALEIAVQVALGLRAMYAQGILHRDIKPGNILFTAEFTAKVADFGLSLFCDEAAAKAGGELIGTPYYLPPERLDGEPEDIRSDIYSLGATLYHAIAGRPPFDAPTPMLVATKRLVAQPLSIHTFAPKVSATTRFCIERMLARQPADRFQDYDELIQHLEYARGLLPSRTGAPAQKVSRIVIDSAQEQKRWSYVALAVFTVCILLGSTLLISKQSARHPPHAKPALKPSSDAANMERQQQMSSARKLLGSGKEDEAATTFHTLAADPGMSPPLVQWCIVQEAIARLASGQYSSASETLESLSAQEPPPDPELRALFADLAAEGANTTMTHAVPVESSQVQGPAAIKLLVRGLKHWELGQFDEAGRLLRQFTEAKPSEASAWMADLHPVATAYLADYSDYQGAIERLKSAATLDGKREAGNNLARLKNKLRRRGKLVDRIENLAAAALGSSASGITNADFEIPPLGAGEFQWQPRGPGWIFEKGAGIAANGSGFTGSNSPAPHGSQVAFIQTQSDIWQLVSGLSPGQTYTLTYSAAQRNMEQKGATWQILVDGAIVGTFDAAQAATAYTDYSVHFRPASPSVVITFHATNLRGGDNTVLIDNVRLTGR